MCFFAVILNGRVKGKKAFSALYIFLPHIISIAIVGLIFSNMFDYFGIVNSWLIKLGLIEREISWFETTGRSMSVLVTSGVWATFGINVLYFVAALSNVPEELYEAAVIDGAGTVRKFFQHNASDDCTGFSDDFASFPKRNTSDKRSGFW